MSTEGISRVAKYTLYAVIIICLVNIASNLIQIDLINSYFVTSELSDETFLYLAERNDIRVQAVSLIYMIILFASFFVIGRWLYLSCKMNHEMKVDKLKYSPGWCVGWHFIPFANLFKPYLALKEIYKASFNTQEWKEQKPHGMFPLWWTTWIISNGFSNLSLRRTFENDFGQDFSFSQLNNIAYLDIAADITLVVCSFALIKIIKVVSNNQSKFDLAIIKD